MVQKITCDACGKDSMQDTTYELKVRSRNTKASLVQDICHQCFMAHITKMGFTAIWRKWNTNLKVWEALPNP